MCFTFVYQSLRRYTVLALDRSNSLMTIFTYRVHVSILCCFTFPFTYTTYSYAANPDNSISKYIYIYIEAIQIFEMNITFISTSEEKCIFHGWQFITTFIFTVELEELERTGFGKPIKMSSRGTTFLFSQTPWCYDK